MGAFLGLALLTYRALRHQDRFPTLARHALIWTLLLAGLYGGLDEIHQIFVPGRTPDVFDWLADVTGVGVAILIESAWQRFRTARG